MTRIIDVSYNCAEHAPDLVKAGVQTVFRYYSRDTISKSKRLTRAEAQSFVSAGLRVGVVHEARLGDQVASFSPSTGEQDGAYARSYGAQQIGQPAGSTIYFAVDLDEPGAIQSRILPYFEGIKRAFAAATGEPAYLIGVYGSGATCQAVLDAGLSDHAWLAQSTGWSGYNGFDKSGRWAMKQGPSGRVGEIDCDPDEANGSVSDIGDFLIATLPVQTQGNAEQVLARAGLKLRSGPGTGYDCERILPLGTSLYPLKAVGDWTMVDLRGDGVSDGFVLSAFIGTPH